MPAVLTTFQWGHDYDPTNGAPLYEQSELKGADAARGSRVAVPHAEQPDNVDADVQMDNDLTTDWLRKHNSNLSRVSEATLKHALEKLRENLIVTIKEVTLATDTQLVNFAGPLGFHIHNAVRAGLKRPSVGAAASDIPTPLKKSKHQREDVLEVLVTFQESDAKEALASYCAVGKRLSADPGQHTLAQINGFLDRYGRLGSATPYIMIDNSSGVGKTQVAFCFARPVLYFVIAGGAIPQTIYTPFLSASTLLLNAIARDCAEVPFLDFGATYIWHINPSLWTAAVILSFLERQMDRSVRTDGLGVQSFVVRGKKTIQNVRDTLGEWRGPVPVVILDEVYVSDDNRAPIKRCIVPLRDTIQAMGLVPILIGSNSMIGSLANPQTVSSRQGGATVPDVLLVVKPLEMRLDILLEVCSSPVNYSAIQSEWATFLKMALPKGRPWFARVVAEAIAQKKGNTLTIDSMTDVLRRCVARLSNAKGRARSSPRGLMAQVCLFLPAHRCGVFKAMAGSTMINEHFANVRGENAELCLVAEGGWRHFDPSNDSSKRWIPHCEIPDLTTEPLLYLLMATSVHPDVSVFGHGRTTLAAFRGCLNPLLADMVSTEALESNGARMEAVATTALCIASSQLGPLNPVPWRDFLVGVGRQLQEEFHADLKFEDCTNSAAEWFFETHAGHFPLMMPVLNEEDGKELSLFDRVWRVKDKDMCDIRTSYKFLSGECKNHVSNITTNTVSESLARLPVDSKVHFVFGQSLSKNFFSDKKVLWTDMRVSSKEAPRETWDSSVALLRLSMDGRLVKLEWLSDKPYTRRRDKVSFGTPRPAHPDRVVIFVGVGTLDTA